MTDLQRFKDLYDGFGIEYMLHVNHELTIMIVPAQEPKVFTPPGTLLCMIFEENKFMHMEIHDKE